MKAITLYQPWASLIALGEKKIETRSWHTNYRGPLAIHASANIPKWAKELCWTEPFRSTLLKHEYKMHLGELPTGMIITTCNLIDCFEIKEIHGRIWAVNPNGTSININVYSNEFYFGDYTPRRYAWILDDIKPIDKPIPAKGHLGLWNWEDIGLC